MTAFREMIDHHTTVAKLSPNNRTEQNRTEVKTDIKTVISELYVKEDLEVGLSGESVDPHLSVWLVIVG